MRTGIHSTNILCILLLVVSAMSCRPQGGGRQLPSAIHAPDKEQVIRLLNGAIEDRKAWEKHNVMISPEESVLFMLPVDHWYDVYPITYSRLKLIAMGSPVVPVLLEIVKDQADADLHGMAWSVLDEFEDPAIEQTRSGKQLTEKSYYQMRLEMLDVLMNRPYGEGGLTSLGGTDRRVLRWLNRLYHLDLDAWLKETAPQAYEFRMMELAKGYDPASDFHHEARRIIADGQLGDAVAKIYADPKDREACQQLLEVVYDRHSALHPCPPEDWLDQLKAWYRQHRRDFSYDFALQRFVVDENKVRDKLHGQGNAAQGGIRADLSGDAVVDFATTMDMPFMTVGNPGNAGELSGDGVPGGHGTDRICGAVDYEYRIGKFEVTAGQYTEFLNAVAKTDTYGLYNEKMWSNEYGCKIRHSGSAGSYTYSVAADWEDRPVNYVSWGDAARFCNWLTNGMPTGAQDLTTTEDGSYLIDGANRSVATWPAKRIAEGDRIPGKKYYFIPSEDEWYKAAYHKNDGVTGNYFDYPTGSDAVPSNDLIDPDPGNNANFWQNGYTIGSPYWRTEAGEFENSASPYETFDMGGNVWEWHELDKPSYYHGCNVRGGSFFRDDVDLQASYRDYYDPRVEICSLGFRVSVTCSPKTRPSE